MYRRIRDLREDRDMTQVQLAKMLNCSQRTYSNYERGDIEISTRVLIELARFHDTSIDYLLGETNQKRRYR
jgi:transcriptional regulator with XRE-family HTH domain